jgi:hypothetical protein
MVLGKFGTALHHKSRPTLGGAFNVRQTKTRLIWLMLSLVRCE